MVKTTKNILSLNHEEVLDFFMKFEQYHGLESSLVGIPQVHTVAKKL